ncbi:hypothetical protein EES45_35100 [Streptomyces sp. ADI97-07]|nr:hypothetical protein EES45_35100 [Streptomyces sp. ADI97-07]
MRESRPARKVSSLSARTTARVSKAVRVVSRDQPTSAGSASLVGAKVRSFRAWARSASVSRPERTQGRTAGASPAAASPAAASPVPAAAAGASAVGARSGAGASVRTMWQLVPPMPKEDTPATSGWSGCGQGPSSRGTRRPSPSRSMAGFGVSKLRLAGISRCVRLRRALSRPTMPAAPSRCPTLVLAEPTTRGSPGARWELKTSPSAAASMGSPTGVPVPCSSTYWTSEGLIPAFS